MENPNIHSDYFEAKETDYLVACDICKKDYLYRDANSFYHPNYNSAIMICRTCFDKIEKGEDLPKEG